MFYNYKMVTVSRLITLVTVSIFVCDWNVNYNEENYTNHQVLRLP